ncbi:MAG: C45 family peptidase [Desulfococcaceae bacterium]|jgi:predicted choloylglycine hydrolase|nr:C45 family peptidase [Desulfococcaceae bacterium]
MFCFENMHYISCGRGSPYETGRERGRVLRQLPGLDSFMQSLLPANEKREMCLEKTRTLSARMEKYLPGMTAEKQGLLDELGWDSEDYDLYHFLPFLFKETALQSCTNFYLSAGRREEGKALAGKIKDYPEVFRHYQEVTSVSSAMSFVCLRNAGWLGCDLGMNESGFCFALASASSGHYSPGITPYVLGTLLLSRARTVAEALNILSSFPGTGEASFLLADAKGAAVVLEWAFGKQYAVRRPESGLLVCTNHYLSPELRQYTAGLKSSEKRYARMRELLAFPPRIKKEQVRKAMQDHHEKNSFHCICRHSREMAGIASALMYPEEKILEIQAGRPCEKKKWEIFSFRTPSA